MLVPVAEREPLADLTAAWLAEHPAAARYFPAAPGEVVDDVLAADRQDDHGQPLHLSPQRRQVRRPNRRGR
jgi:hypothetical protein